MGWPATWTVVVIGWPTSGLAVVEEIEVEDDCWPTVTVAGEEVVLAVKLASPG